MELPKGQSAERNNGAANLPGIYKADDKEVITSPGAEGAVQADALVRLGFSRVGDVPTREQLLERNKKQLEADEKADEKDNKATK